MGTVRSRHPRQKLSGKSSWDLLYANYQNYSGVAILNTIVSNIFTLGVNTELRHCGIAPKIFFPTFIYSSWPVLNCDTCVVLQHFLMHSLTQNCNFATHMAFLLQQWGEERLEKGCASLLPAWCHFSYSPAKVFWLGVMLCGAISYQERLKRSLTVLGSILAMFTCLTWLRLQY